MLTDYEKAEIEQDIIEGLLKNKGYTLAELINEHNVNPDNENTELINLYYKIDDFIWSNEFNSKEDMLKKIYEYMGWKLII